MAEKTILVADDDPHIRRLIAELLSAEGYKVLLAEDGEAAMKICCEERPDLVILDIIMPKMDGMEVCRRLRDETAAPIVFLTAKDDITDLVSGLAIGGDDYITKPFKGAELIARVKAALRRADMVRDPTELEEYVSVGGLEIDRKRREISLDGRPVNLTQTEFDLLWLLASHRGTVFSRKDIVKALWGYEDPGISRTIDTHIARLRKKIERDSSNPEFIKTVTGVGYKFF
ncbi:MAG: response regulator transcription factor [Actinobacteria bacterium]|nr:response regulator transcription factor [Actinomycetota bacterium]MDI6830892.1 response regulator transcription factor [Actinomycetota bacterium]